ncbi:IS66 family transposase [Chitinophaga sancti]|uniref:IS66 family transposase n=1 Tax=Chitinophaga sancti TaxID=1004 RepID=UPI0037431764
MLCTYRQLRPESLIVQAFAHSIKRWKKLNLYAHTGNLMQDNNAFERCMRNAAAHQVQV